MIDSDHTYPLSVCDGCVHLRRHNLQNNGSDLSKMRHPEGRAGAYSSGSLLVDDMSVAQS